MVLSSIFLSLDPMLNFESFQNRNLYLLYGLIGLLFIGFIYQKAIFRLEERWKTSGPQSYENTSANPPTPDPMDSLATYLRLDQNVIQVITDTKTKFKDVAGNEEAKTELEEIIRFLKDPSSFTKLGALAPKGVLIGGPPGTGKTLLAKAVAGEAGTPFLRVSGSQFVELLVGVGASRVRELFEKARSIKPCIIFIDEIDAIARSRSPMNSMGGGSDEREQTLNQILTEMDGFEVDTGIVVIGATNRTEILDSAIKRPGRFDRQINVSNPNLREREAILNVHAIGKRFDESVSLARIAQKTLGFSGADLANVLNEAAIIATRRKKNEISAEEIDLAIEKVALGLEGSNLTRIKAVLLSGIREIGEAFILSLKRGISAVDKVTLVPRGNNQASTFTLPSSSQYTTRSYFVSQILVALGGRAAEELANGPSESTVGAQQNIYQLTRTIRLMISKFAMVKLDEIKQQSQKRNLYFLGSDAKKELNDLVDRFVTNFIDLTYNEIISFLGFLKPGGERLVDELILSEELTSSELRAVAREYISGLGSSKVANRKRQSYLTSFLEPEIRKSLEEVESELDDIEFFSNNSVLSSEKEESSNT